MNAKTLLSAALTLSMVTLLSGCLERGEGESASVGFFASVGAKVVQGAGLADHKLDYVFKPGVSLVVDREAVKVYGQVDCPPVEDQGALWNFLFGIDPNEPPEKNCIIIRQDTLAVDVSFPKQGTLIKERWTVERTSRQGAELLRLRRPNGDYVSHVPSTVEVVSAERPPSGKQSLSEEYRSF